MAKDKKSFLLYCDQITSFSNLTDEEAGKLIKHIFEYVNDLNPIMEDRLIQIAFEPIKLQLKRDLIKYEGIREKRSLAGVKSAEQRQQMSTSVESVQQTSTNSTVNVNDNVKDNVIVKDKVNKVDERKLKFAHSLESFLPKYGKETIREFFDYWTEPNLSNTKMRFELQKTWSLNLRLEKWSSRESSFKTKIELPKSSTPKYTTLADINKPLA